MPDVVGLDGGKIIAAAITNQTVDEIGTYEARFKSRPPKKGVADNRRATP